MKRNYLKFLFLSVFVQVYFYQLLNLNIGSLKKGQNFMLHIIEFYFDNKNSL